VDFGIPHAKAQRSVSIPQHGQREPPLFVHLTRMAGLLTLFAGIILMVAANAVIGVAIVLLSALYFALAEIIRYLALIARGQQEEPSFFQDADPEELGSAVDATR
jgi:predicted RND superfamily exporter protein